MVNWKWGVRLGGGGRGTFSRCNQWVIKRGGELIRRFYGMTGGGGWGGEGVYPYASAHLEGAVGKNFLVGKMEGG